MFGAQVQFLACIFNTSTAHHDMLGVAATFSPYCEIVKIARSPSGGDPDSGRPNIENNLFELVLLAIPAVLLAACLGA